ncbi:alpha/beta hydrolase [Dialister sp.]|uniref:alpha/beta hydrolase n=1 Tax=Dialister sp. TaxID=1955814 RepID=UPI003F020247
MGKIAKALAALALGAVTAYLVPRRKAESLPAGESSYFLEDPSGTCRDPIPVYYYKPATWTEDQPVFIAFPGYTRKAERFEKHLEDLAVRFNMLIACPEFSFRKFPGARWYQEGNISDAEGEKGQIQPRRQWTFDAIDHVTAAVRRRTKAKGKVILFGHSAGGQLMHRYSLFASHPMADAIICANAGWFTMPDDSICYPYGIKGVPLSDRDLARAFSRPVIMLMGGNDISRKKPFRDTPEADAQGQNRMERCNNYFHFCEARANALGVPFRWQLKVVDGAAHEGAKMAEGAMKLFCQEPLDETVGM